MQSKVIYTAIFGGYDDLPTPTNIPKGWDFVCFTDNKDLKSDLWETRYVLPVYEDVTRNARRAKVLTHQYLPEYDISMWNDGNIDIIGDVDEMIDRYLVDSNIALFDHNQNEEYDRRNCVYDEAQVIFQFGARNMQLTPERGLKNYKDDPFLIKRQIERYMHEGYPKNNGLSTTPTMLRRHNELDVIKSMERWWEEIEYGSKRDQISFNYSMWKTDTKFTHIDGDSRNNKWVKSRGKHSGK